MELTFSETYTTFKVRMLPYLRIPQKLFHPEGGLPVLEISKPQSLPKSTLENWMRGFKAGQLGKIGTGQRPLTDIERELAQVKRELSLAKMERDLLKKAAAHFAKE